MQILLFIGLISLIVMLRFVLCCAFLNIHLNIYVDSEIFPFKQANKIFFYKIKEQFYQQKS